MGANTPPNAPAEFRIAPMTPVKSKNSSEAPVISILKLLHGDRYPSQQAIDRPPRAINQRWPNP
jgi:hypothetical protein